MNGDLITLGVNGKQYSVKAGPYELLSKVLRDDLGLTGTKRGCDFGGCGACTVLLDGKAVYSCMMPARHTEGHEITTVEGLAEEGKLSPIQEAFIRNTAFQCGYCTPGIIMAATALLNQKKDLTEEDIREGLAGNLCRCTGYVSIFKAIMEAAQISRGAE